MYSFTNCHFCKEPLYKFNCKNPNCEKNYEYQTYPDIKLIDFYIGKYIVECVFNEDDSPKSMRIFESGYESEAFILDHHMDINKDNYVKVIDRIEKLQTLK